MASLMFDFQKYRRFNDATDPKVSRVIGLCGYAQSGKDTAGAIIKGLYGHEIASFSDVLREFLYAQNLFLEDGTRLNTLVDSVGWEEARIQVPYIRNLQQLTGTEAARNILGQSVWIDAVMNRLDPGGLYVFTSVRYPNEIEELRSINAKIYWVERPGVGPVNDHSSDNLIGPDDCDDVIINDGTISEFQGEIMRVLGSFR